MSDKLRKAFERVLSPEYHSHNSSSYLLEEPICILILGSFLGKCEGFCQEFSLEIFKSGLNLRSPPPPDFCLTAITAMTCPCFRL